MANKEPLFEGTVAELLKEWWNSNLDKGGHWLDKANKRIVIYPAARAWDHLVEENRAKEKDVANIR